MGRFIRDAAEVEAYQYTGNNLSSIIKAFEEVGFELRTMSHEDSKQLMLYVEDSNTWDFVYVGDYFVRLDGELRARVYTGWLFQKDFRPYVEEQNGLQDQIDAEAEVDLRSDLTKLLNSYNAEAQSGTPDFILADVALRAIEAFNDSVIGRAGFRKERWQYEPGNDPQHLASIINDYTDNLDKE